MDVHDDFQFAKALVFLGVSKKYLYLTVSYNFDIGSTSNGVVKVMRRIIILRSSMGWKIRSPTPREAA